MLKGTRDYIGFALLCSVIGTENSCHSPIRCETKTNHDLVAFGITEVLYMISLVENRTFILNINTRELKYIKVKLQVTEIHHNI